MLLCRTCNTGFGLRFDRLLDEIPPEIFNQWQLLYSEEPWDAERNDEAIGTLIKEMAAMAGKTTTDPAEYMFYLRRQKHRHEKPDSEAKMKATFGSICEARRQM